MTANVRGNIDPTQRHLNPSGWPIIRHHSHWHAFIRNRLHVMTDRKFLCLFLHVYLAVISAPFPSATANATTLEGLINTALTHYAGSSVRNFVSSLSFYRSLNATPGARTIHLVHALPSRDHSYRIVRFGFSLKSVYPRTNSTASTCSLTLLASPHCLR